MTRRDFLAASTLVTAGLMAGCGVRIPRTRKPSNLVLIISDTLRADHLTCNGFPASVTPGIDALARRGTLFTDVLSPAPLTAAAHASIMTGTYQTLHGVPGNRGAIASGVSTFPEMLQAAGLETAAFVSNPVLQPEHLAGIERGYEVYDADLPSMERNRPSPYRDAQDTTEAVFHWLQTRSAGRFFLWVHYMEPHGPYEVPEPHLLDRVRGILRSPDEPDSLRVLPGNYGTGGIPKYQVLEDERDPLVYRRRYAARVAYVDREIQRLTQELRRLELESETLIVLASDHGELLGEHGYYFQHGITLLQPVLRVPILFAGPGVPAGGRPAVPASLVDLAPTMLDFLGLEPDSFTNQFQGISLRPAIEGQPDGDAVPHYAFCERTRESCIRIGRSKLTVATTGAEVRRTFVDLDGDPEERSNIAHDRPDLVNDLEDRLQQFTTVSSGPESRPPALPTLTEEDRARLRSLGYLE